ncbi:MAG TPA: hypothetical protein VK448_02320 [Dissulfurispiraceae bacterium]|nr:hypothetical protein [Dissulfurispiraceae bacterium]
MYFVSYNPLKERLRNRTITDREALPYLILLVTLEMIVLSIPNATEMNIWTVVEAILNTIATIFGVYYVYQKNGGSSGYDIINKYVVLGWVVCVRYAIVVMPLGILIIIIAGYYGLVGNETTLFDAIFYPIISVIYYERLGRHIADTKL